MVENRQARFFLLGTKQYARTRTFHVMLIESESNFDDFERQQFRDQVSLEHDWKKVIIINPMDHTKAFEI